MYDHRQHDLLARALDRIEMQDAQIARLAPKAEAYDRLGQVLDLATRRGGESYCAEVDVRYELREAIDRLQRQAEAEKAMHRDGRNPGSKPSGEDALAATLYDVGKRHFHVPAATEEAGHEVAGFYSTKGTVTAAADLAGVADTIQRGDFTGHATTRVAAYDGQGTETPD